jgi:hypothetical protein
MVAGFVEVAENEDFRGCGGPIRTEYTIIEHTVSQRIDSRSCLSLMFSSVSNEEARRQLCIADSFTGALGKQPHMLAYF